MVINKAYCLEIGIDNFRANKGHASFFEVFAYHASNREVGDFDVLFEYEADMRQIQFDKAHLVPFKWMKDVVVEEVAPEQRVLLKLQESARRAVAKLTG